MAQMNRPELAHFASEYARESPKHGFHNEIITKTQFALVFGALLLVLFFLAWSCPGQFKA